MGADNFNLETLIRSIKELRNMELAQQLREALRTQELGTMDASLISEMVEEIENDLEEHISRLERIYGVLTEEERARPETMTPARQQEVAWQSKCDLDEVQGLCEAFARAREILGTLGGERRMIDLRLLLTNMGGVMGVDAVQDTPNGIQFNPEFLKRLVQKGALPARSDKPKPRADLAEFEAQFDMDAPAQPKNRLPKDWRAK